MKYIDFQNFFKNHLLINVQEVKQIFPDFESRRFYEWQKKGYIRKVASQFYIFADKKISESENNFIANKLSEPSYVSLESALRYYNLIPEIVFLTTSVSTRKTKLIKTAIGNFQYRLVKENLFFGYKIVDFNGIAYKIAEPEKALLDFLYLRSDLKTEDDFSELRINEGDYRETINQNKLKEYLEVFNSNTLNKKIKVLNNFFKT
jgi:predicted transcriptional regulator of viral defense system